MNTFARAAILFGFVGALAVAVPANASAEGPGWFREAVTSLLARLQQIGTATTQNTASIATLTSEVNALKNSGAQTYDYRDYDSVNISLRTYLTQGAGVCGATEIQSLARTPLPDGSIQISQVRERRTAGNVTCQFDVFDFRATGDGLYLSSRTGYNTANTAEVMNTNVLDTPLPQRTTTMRIGASSGSAAGLTTTSYPSGTMTLGAATQINSLLAVESVTVPAGTYANCLKISEVRNSSSIGNFTQVSWYCQGVGLTKRILQNTSSATGFTLELQSAQ